MWYWAYNPADQDLRIGHATSPDGITWTKDINNPVLDAGPSGAWDENWVYDQECIINRFHFPYVVYWSYWHRLIIKTIGSVTPLPQMESPGQRIQITRSWIWDRLGPGMITGLGCSVIYDGSEYHMWYTGYGVADLIRIGHATSPDGVTWTKDPLNPVLIEERNSWEWHKNRSAGGSF